MLCLAVLATTNVVAQSDVEKLKSAFKSEMLNLTGYAHVIYSANEHPALGLGNNDVNSSFDLARAVLTAIGTFGDKKQFKYSLQYNFVSSSSGLMDLYGEWDPVQAANFRFGQFKIPFTMEMPMSATRVETIYSTRPIAAMAGGRDIGVQLSGKAFQGEGFSKLVYAAGIFNGTGKNAKDNNNHKDVIGTVYVQPIKGLRVNGSIYSGKTYGTVNGVLPLENHVHNLWSVGLDYNITHFSGRSEYLSANDGGIHKEGYYGLAVYKIVPNKWEILGKYDVYNRNKDISDSKITDITAGVNYYFAYLTRVQLNYIATNNQKEGKNNAVAVCLQLYF